MRNLVELNVDRNKYITNVNHLKKLQILSCRMIFHYLYSNGITQYGIDQYGISEVTQLIKLNAMCNSKITSVNHLKNLTDLNASCCLGSYDSCKCGISQTGINELKNLVKLDVTNNKLIIDVSHLTKLKVLNGRAINNDNNNDKKN